VQALRRRYHPHELAARAERAQVKYERGVFCLPYDGRYTVKLGATVALRIPELDA